MGTGAVVATSLFSATDLNQQGAPVAGPMAAFITVHPGVSQAAALRSLDHVAAVLNRSSDPDAPVGGVVSALRPAEIADTHSISKTPALLAAVLAAGAVGALGLTLDRVGPPAPAPVRPPESAGIHPGTDRRIGGLAVVGGGGRRGGARCPHRDRPGALVVDVVR